MKRLIIMLVMVVIAGCGCEKCSYVPTTIKAAYESTCGHTTTINDIPITTYSRCWKVVTSSDQIFTFDYDISRIAEPGATACAIYSIGAKLEFRDCRDFTGGQD